MKPEMILHADLLDIIFQGRNQAYGAYNLRKYYNSRLAKSVAVMFAIVLSLSMSWFIYARSSGSMQGKVAILTTDVHLDPLAPEPVKKSAAPKPVAKPRNIAQVHDATLKIVPDKDVIKPMAKVEDLNDKQISLTDKPGDAATATDVLPPSDGVPGGTGMSIAPAKPVIEEVLKPIINPDVMPEFPGGKDAFMKFMLRNLHEADDLEEGQKIVVLVKFVVGADGTISDTEIMQSGGKYDAEVLRVVKKMPRWKPGIQSGRPVPVYFRLPITFQNGN